jgi:hypothetical protein
LVTSLPSALTRKPLPVFKTLPSAHMASINTTAGEACL